MTGSGSHSLGVAEGNPALPRWPVASNQLGGAPGRSQEWFASRIRGC